MRGPICAGIGGTGGATMKYSCAAGFLTFFTFFTAGVHPSEQPLANTSRLLLTHSPQHPVEFDAAQPSQDVQHLPFTSAAWTAWAPVLQPTASKPSNSSVNSGDGGTGGM